MPLHNACQTHIVHATMQSCSVTDTNEGDLIHLIVSVCLTTLLVH